MDAGIASREAFALAPSRRARARWRLGGLARARLKRLSVRAAWWGLLGLYLGVRLYHLDQAPPHHATADEYAWTWSGMTLIQNHWPEAWSQLAAYKHVRRNREWRGHGYRMVKPWLDHPPAYSLYAGACMLAWGHKDIFDVDLWQMRTGTLLLDVITFVLLTLVLRRLVSSSEVLIALLLYAVAPAIVLQQRLVVSENLFVPTTLAVVLLTLQQRTRFSMWRTVFVFLLCALLPMTKVAALSASVFLLLWALVSLQLRERWIVAGAVAIGTCLGIGAFLWYGRHIDAAMFEAVMTNHRDRFRGFAGMEILLFEPKIISHLVRNPLFVLGCALSLASLWTRRVAPWGLAVLAYTACMAFFVDQERVYGWYFLPLYPWLCTALAVAIVHASRFRVLGLSLLWCSVAWLTIADVTYTRALVSIDVVRFGYLGGLLALYGVWAAWPRFARLTMPLVNGLLVAGVAVAFLYDVYLR